MDEVKYEKEWWLTDDVDRVDSMMLVVKRARDGDAGRETRLKYDTGIYLNRHIQELTGNTYNSARGQIDNPRIPLAKSATDSVHAKLLRNLPRTVPLTERSTWGMRRMSQYLGGFIEGVKSRNNWNVLFRQIVLDSMIWGDGIVWVRGETDGVDRTVGRVVIERVFPWQVRVDPEEADHGNPRSSFIELPMDRYVAAATWPEHREAILKASTLRQNGQKTAHPNHIMVITGWHLPSVKGADDGRMTVVVEGQTMPILDKQWKMDRFPWVRMSWHAPLIAHWGHSFVDGVSGIHVSLNEIDQVIRDRMGQSFGFVTVSNGSGFEEIDNDTGIKVYKTIGDNGDVRYHSPNLVSSEHFMERDNLIQLGYQMMGVSQMSATGMKPAGLDAAVALREHQDIESERFTVQGEAMEEFDLTTSKLLIETARTLFDEGMDVEVKRNRKRMRKTVLQKIKWSKIKLDEDAYELQCFPTSQLPRQLSGRMALVEQLIAAGFFDQKTGLQLLDIPDVEGAMSDTLAPFYIILDMIETMIEDNKKMSPIPEMDLQLTASVTNLAILQATIDEVPDERIALLRAFATQTQQLIKRSQPEPMMPAAPGAEQFVPNPAGQLQPGMSTAPIPAGKPAVA